MKINIHLILVAIFATLSCSSDNDAQPVQPQPDPPVQPQPVQTTIYLIRHAEKADSGANTNLSAAGLQRAENWSVLLQDVNFDAFYSTNYNRTLQTIQPTATADNKQVTVYDPASFSLAAVVANHLGKNVFIVGHSNTIPQLVNSYLGSDVYPDMAETEFGNLYNVTIVDGVVTHMMTVHN